jgi:hypothetical protein
MRRHAETMYVLAFTVVNAMIWKCSRCPWSHPFQGTHGKEWTHGKH